ALPAQAQSSRAVPTSTAQVITINGRVVADETGDPIPNARVTRATVAPGSPVVLTDRDGRFAFAAPPGRHSVVASKSGRGRSEVTTTITDGGIELPLRQSS